MNVTSKLHTQEYRDTELNIVIDEIGPGEGLLDSGGIEIPLKPAGKGGVAQFPAGSPAQATACGSVVRAEITNIFGPKDSMQDTTLLAGATMLLSNERNYCHTSGQRVKDSSKALRIRESPPDLLRREGGVHRRRGSVGSRAHRASGAR